MNRNESIIKEIYEKRGYVVVHSNSNRFEKGYPDFKIFNFKSGKRFFLEVKSQKEAFLDSQINKFRELIESGYIIFVAVVFPDLIKVYEIDSNLNKKEIEEIKIENIKNIKIKTCERCNYKWNPILDNPVSCPRCKRRFDYGLRAIKTSD